MRSLFGFTRYSNQGNVGDTLSQAIGLVERGLGFLISTSLFLAASGAFKLYFGFLLYGVEPRWNLLAATFFIVFAVYGANKLTDIKEDEVNNPERVRYVKRLAKALKYSVILSFVMTLVLGAFSGIGAILVLIFPIVAGVLYSVRILPGRRRLKDITGVKNLIIAITWASGTAFLPYIAAGGIDFSEVFLVYYFFFMKSLINTMLFDVRDIEGDRINGIKTIPVKLGLEKSRILLILFNSSFIPWLFIAHSFGYFTHYLPVLLFAVFNGYAYILYFSRRSYRPGKILDVWVDGEWFYTLPLAMLM